MSRTEGFSLPRIPASHSKLVDPSKTWTANPRSRSIHTRSHSEPAYYTSYLCCPRQDVPDYVLRDAPTFDETFDKVGAGFGLPRLESAKVDRPLTSFEYDSLHDPHVRHLYMKNGNLRRNLISRGLVTAELKVVGSEREFREHVRAHEMFERKEILERLLDEKERDRMKRMTTPKSTNRLPVRIQTELERDEKRRRLAEERLARLAREKNRKEENLQHRRALQSEADKRARMERIRAMKLEEERKQRMARQFEEDEFNRKYNSKFKGVPHGSEIAAWHREAEILEHRIQVRNYLGWKGRRRTRSADDDYVLPCSESEGEEEEESAETEPQVIVEEVRQEVKEVESLALNLEELEKELQAVEEEEAKKETEEEAVAETAEKETVLQPDPTSDLLQKIALDAFSRADLDDDGRLSHQEFATVLQELNFELDEHEIGDLLLEANPQGSETIDYVSSLPRLPAMLVNLYQKRGDNEKTEGDTSWIPLYLSSSKSYVFFEKTSGQITAAVPPEWAPKIRDDLFVDTMMDIFTSGDLNQDGYIDRDEFYQLLQSPDVGLAYFSQSQADDLFAFFNANTRDGHMTFDEFLPLARTMIQLIYQNSDPSPYPWVELDSPKAGGLFWFNKFTSEVSMYPPSARDENETVDDPATPLSPVREQRSLLPPIQEAPSDRDTLSGSVGDVELVAAKLSSAHPSLSVEERPSSPLPPPATPEVNNRPVDVSEKARSPERRRRRRRRKRTEAGDHEERRRRRRRHHSRRESERGRDSERAEEEEEIQKTEEKEEVVQEEKEKDEAKEEDLVDTAPIEKDEEDEPPLKKDDESTLKEIEPIEEETNKDEEIVTKHAEEPEESDVIVVQSDVEESPPEKNLADDEKISLGVTSSSSLRPSSAAKPPPSSRHSRTSLSSTRVPEERPPITDEEKIESRRNSVAN